MGAAAIAHATELPSEVGQPANHDALATLRD
jgi:hypothetical protein